MEPTHEHEDWRPVAGASGYEVSSLGRVRSIDRIVYTTSSLGRRYPRQHHGKVLKTSTLPPPLMPYKQLVLTYDNGARRTRTVHILVCEAFRGPKPTQAHEVRHLNGNPRDNRATNLKWGTRSENSHDTVSHGNNQWANKTHCPQDHPYEGDNLLIEGRARRCRTCTRERKRIDMRNRRKAKRQENAQ